MSGFLIWLSIGRSKSFVQYCKKRFWRIFPELWVAIAIEIAVLLVLYNHPIEWGKLIGFAFAQGSIFQFWTPDFLRGYGCGTPNGSLWTICVLIQFYIVAYLVYKWLKGKNWTVWILTFVLSVGVSALTPIVKVSCLKLLENCMSRHLFLIFGCFL